MEGKIKYIRAGCEIEERTVEEILEEIKRYAVGTGGFRLIEEKEIPKYIVITRSRRPGPSYDAKSEREVLEVLQQLEEILQILQNLQRMYQECLELERKLLERLSAHRGG